MNVRQKRFALEYLKDKNATQSAIRAGYSKNTARIIASNLLTKIDIQEFIDSEIKKQEEKVLISADWVLKNLKEISERCMKEGKEFDSAGANKALELIGKHLKLFTDRIENNVKVSYSDILKLIKEAGKERNLD